MSKEAYYFSHDANARNDPKILAMRSDHGIQGYGTYWIIVEMLREQNEYKLPTKKYIWNAIAMQVQCKDYAKDNAKDFVESCINEYELFESDGDFFWSNSLLKRMEKKNELSEKRSAAAKARWDKTNDGADGGPGKKLSDANAMQVDANAMQVDARKGKERKGKEIKESKVKQQHPELEPKEKEQKKEPQPKNVVEGSAIKFYQENGFGAITPVVGNKVFAWVDDLSESLVIHAMTIAAENGVTKWSYVETILKDWYNKKIKSIEEVQAIELQRKQQQQKTGTSYGRKPINKDKLPEWFDKHKETRGNKDANVEENEVDGDFIEKRRLLLEKLGIKE